MNKLKGYKLKKKMMTPSLDTGCRVGGVTDIGSDETQSEDELELVLESESEDEDEDDDKDFVDL